MLQGVRVVDLSGDVAGAYATRFFAAFGADVIKVEPPGGDPTRFLPPRAGDAPEQSILFAYLNAGKRSVALDADDAAQREQLLGLLATADLVVESSAPGAWASRGVDLGDLLEAHPRLVVCSITPFGQDGPRAGWRTTALTAFASGGQMILCGDPDRPPLKTAGYQASYQAGLHGFAASMLALLAARRTGVGDRIDISMQEAQAASLEAAGPTSMVRGFDAERTGNQMRAVWGIYPSADGYVGVASMARQMASVYRCIGHPELLDDPVFTTSIMPPEINDVLSALIAEWTASRSGREIWDESGRHRAPFTLIPTPRELLDWPSLRESGFWVEVEHPALGRHLLPNSPFALNGDRGTVTRAPLLGEHSGEVLAEGSRQSAVGSRTDDRGGSGQSAVGSRTDGSASDDNRHSGGPRPTPDTRHPIPASAPPLAEGLRVLDLTQVWAGPYATRFFADMGADVIHIEGPGFPDAVRAVGRLNDPRGFNKSPYFNEYNRNKRGLALDLHRPEGLAAFHRLVQQADVVIENWSVGVSERLGLSYSELRALNPRIILVQMPAFSLDGAESERVGFGPSIEQMGGLVSLQGYEDGPPHKSGISYGDPTAGIVAAGATAMALYRREQTGDGCHVVVRQRDNVIGLIGEYLVAESLGRPLPVRIGNRDPQYAPHGVYQTRDDSGRFQSDAAGNPLREFHDTWLAIAVDSDVAWRGLCSVVDDARLDDTAYASTEGRFTGASSIDAVLTEWAREQEPEAAAARLHAAGVSAMPVLSPLMLLRDRHLAERGFFPTVQHPEAGSYTTTRPVWRLLRRPFSGTRPAPCFGEHNREVLRTLAGYSEAEIAALAATGVIADQPLGE
ncbi:MAG: CaiB/BaiF CoA transferase family protein [Dehalococcoidia bacterium]